MPLRRLLASTLAAAGLAAAGSAPAHAAPYVPGEVVVQKAGSVTAKVVRVPRGESVHAAAARLDRHPGVTAAPNYLAHVSGGYFPPDPGRGGGWSRLQWNFLGTGFGINAPAAWGAARAAGHPGARGVKIAVLDTGVAYRTVHGWRRSPDFTYTKFLPGYDFVDHDPRPVDFYGHGTHVAGTIAESTGNHIGVTGLAYRASIMPVRVLDQNGYGDAATIAKGIVYAVKHGAKLINLSLEFPPDVRAGEIPSIMKALSYARAKGRLVVAASGNEGEDTVAYPARASSVLSVGATTSDGCLTYYSNGGSRLDLVAPGGGDDADIPGDPHCDVLRSGPPIYQETYTRRPNRFGLPGGYEGTSMAAPHVTGIAALTIATRVLGSNPSPARLIAHLEDTARDLGPPGADRYYGHGLLDGAAATARP